MEVNKKQLEQLLAEMVYQSKTEDAKRPEGYISESVLDDFMTLIGWTAIGNFKAYWLCYGPITHLTRNRQEAEKYSVYHGVCWFRISFTDGSIKMSELEAPWLL